MKKMNPLLMMVLALTIAMASCKKEVIPTPAAAAPAATSQHPSLKTAHVTPQTCGTPTTVCLKTSQNVNAGTVTVSNDATNLIVTYTTSGGWRLRNINLYVGSCSSIPLSRQQTPILGQFPYSAALGNATQYTFTIPLSALDNCVCIAAEAEVSCSSRTATVWAEGIKFAPRCSPASYFNYCKQSCGTCIAEAGILFSNENAWPYGVTSVVIGGYSYTATTCSYVYFSGLYTDSRTSLMLIATLKIYGNNISVPASIASDAATVEAWLSTLGPQTNTSAFTAPANVETAIANLAAWESSHTCH